MSTSSVGYTPTAGTWNDSEPAPRSTSLSDGAQDAMKKGTPVEVFIKG
jgi:hypothetical protein